MFPNVGLSICMSMCNLFSEKHIGKPHKWMHLCIKTSHPVISPTTFHLNPTRWHTSPGTLNSSTNFLYPSHDEHTD